MHKAHGALAAASLAAGLLLASQAAQATVFDNTADWSGDYAFPFGPGGAETFGESFVAPSDSTLDNFTFFLGTTAGADLQVQAQVFAVSGAQGFVYFTGAVPAVPVFVSAPITYSSNLATGVFDPVTVDAGGVNLVAGDDYVALFSVLGPDPTDLTNTNADVDWAIINAVGLPNDGGGDNIFTETTSYADLVNGVCCTGYGGEESEWQATFGQQAPTPPVPEPASLALLGTALIGLGAARRRKRKTT